MGKSKGARIRELRTALNLKQEKFATEADLSLSTLQKAEIDQGSTSFDTILKLSKRFGCPVEWLDKGVGTLTFNPDWEKKYDPTEALLYKELKEQNTYLQNKLNQAMDAVTTLINKGSLGKLKSFAHAGLFSQEDNRAKVRV